MKERIILIKRFVELFGKEGIEAVVADREFIGSEWLSFLEAEFIPFHLSDIDRINKLVAVVSIAFSWAYKACIYVHQNIKPIVIKKHKRKAHSFFKYGLKFITNALLVCFDQLITFINVLSYT